MLPWNTSTVKPWQLVVAVVALVAIVFIGLIVVVDKFVLQPVH